MKIRTIAAALFIGTSTFSFAQFTNCKVEDITKLKAGTLTVALSNDEESTKEIAALVATSWTASKYNVIKKSELEAFVKANPENHILMYLMDNDVQVTYKSSGSRRTFQVGDALVLVENAKKIKKLKVTDAMAYSFIDVDLGAADAAAEFKREVGELNAIMIMPNLTDDKIGKWKVPTMSQQEIKGKELWVSESDLNTKDDLAKMKAAYNPNKFKVVSKDEIAKAITEKRKDIVYLAAVEYQAGAYMFIVHAATDNKALFFMGGTKGFDSKSLEKIKNNKTYGQ
ncbi:MAG: hypothetical protein M3R27_00810 [Bacteroidota bacterium]|nr:hypothetical protein [Bacteroidota bacterium]